MRTSGNSMMDEALWGISGTVRIVTPPKGAGTTQKCETPLLDAHHPPIWGGAPPAPNKSRKGQRTDEGKRALTSHDLELGEEEEEVSRW